MNVTEMRMLSIEAVRWVPGAEGSWVYLGDMIKCKGCRASEVKVTTVSECIERADDDLVDREPTLFMWTCDSSYFLITAW